MVYFTHPNMIAGPERTDLVGLYNVIRKPMQAQNHNFHFRLDVYFLPGGDKTDCKAHYLAARASRPSYESLLEEFKQKRRNNDSSHPPGRLPGVPHSYPGPKSYQSLLSIFPEPNWRDGSQRISCLMFDPTWSQDRTRNENGEVRFPAPATNTLNFRVSHDRDICSGYVFHCLRYLSKVLLSSKTCIIIVIYNVVPIMRRCY
ncbi:uncharacterized protein BDV17DRAFT_258525 [Aspergillus undulatus]|uniref:uncharacterized protein n=1 Tax=Aspergillus undulatus TaxID=1810928 RepID=UPI003CCD4EF0